MLVRDVYNMPIAYMPICSFKFKFKYYNILYLYGIPAIIYGFDLRVRLFELFIFESAWLRNCKLIMKTYDRSFDNIIIVLWLYVIIQGVLINTP